MQIGKINVFNNYYNTGKYSSSPAFTRRLSKEEEADYNTNAIKSALDYLGVVSVAMVLHGPCNPVKENDLGIGSPVSATAKQLINLERLHGFNANQLGPMGEITRGDISPYSGSIFALNKMFIDADELATDKYANIINDEELKSLRVKYYNDVNTFEYSKFFDAFENYDKIIKDAYENFKDKVRVKDKNAMKLLKEYNDFKARKGNKMLQAGIFEVLSRTYGTRDTDVWESEIDRNLISLLKKHDIEAINRYRQILSRSKEDINSYVFGQFLVDKQLKENKVYRDSIGGFEYINDNLVGNDTSEEWMHREIFLKDFRLGCPEGGLDGGPQLWDIPVLDPKKLFNKNGSIGPAGKFLKEKLESGLEYCENIRIDHVLGLVDPYVYDKKSVSYVNGHLDWSKFRANNMSKLKEIDPDGNYQKVLEQIVLPTLASHGIPPEKAVWEDLGNQTDVFRSIYKNELNIPGMTQLHWERGEGTSRRNWALMGSHDEPAAIKLIQDKNFTDNWDKGNGAWHIDYLAGYLNSDPKRQNEKEAFKQKLLENPMERVKAKFAELFTTADRIQIPFNDFFGIEERYNEKGTKSAYNWKLRLNNNFEDEYYKNLEREAPTALNIPEILKTAVQAKIDMDVVNFSNRFATMPDGSQDEAKIDEFRGRLNERMAPTLEKLGYYAEVLKEKTE